MQALSHQLDSWVNLLKVLLLRRSVVAMAATKASNLAFSLFKRT